jgi:peptidoglycan/xylan/chitin deacetylase (PgdA/CDA1 family)
MKAMIRSTVAGIYYASSRLLDLHKGKVAILAYHRVVSEKELNQHYIQPGMYVNKGVFESQMMFLSEHFQILTFAELLAMWKENKCNANKRYCVITFDDGWLDNYLYAYPILLKYKIPATIFLPTAMIGSHQWFWPDKLSYLLRQYYQIEKTMQSADRELLLHTYPWIRDDRYRDSDDKIDHMIEQCKERSHEEVDTLCGQLSRALHIEVPNERLVVNWDEIKEMSKHDISFGSHTATHAILTALTPSEIRREMVDSLNTLRDKKINHAAVFCYPNGNCNQEIAQQAKDAGYQAAVTVKFGLEQCLSPSQFGLKRIGIHNDISSSTSLFAYRISGIRL